MNMFLTIEKVMRGGMTYVTQIYAKASKKYLPDYNVNNLYEWAISQLLP